MNGETNLQAEIDGNIQNGWLEFRRLYGAFFFVSKKVERKEKSIQVDKLITLIWISFSERA